MKTQLAKVAFAVAFALGLCFAQGAPERLAVYVYGANEAGINKSLSSKLLAAMVQSDLYTEIGDPVSFQDELAKSNKSDLASIIQVAKRYGSDYVCAVNIAEVFGTYSITGRLIKIAGNQVAKTGSVDHSLKSLEDLTAVSNGLAVQLLPHSAVVAPHTPVVESVPSVVFAAPPQDTVPPPPPPPAPPPLAAVLAPVAAQKQCARNYNINELLFKIKDGFPTKLNDCSSTLSKDMLNPFGKKLEPKSFMIQCPIDGIKKELPEGFPNTDKILGSLTNFTQGLINSASAGGAIDPKKLVNAVGNMNVEQLLCDVRNVAATAECVVDEPYSPSPLAAPAPAENVAKSNSGKEEEDNSALSLGFRAGINGSSTYAKYSGDNGNYDFVVGMQLGIVLDYAVSSWFHLQPGFMYIQKGMEDKKNDVTAHYIELPLLISFKFSAFRLNLGPYVGLCLSSDVDVFEKGGFDIGSSVGIGFDIDMFYIGLFENYGFSDVSNVKGFSLYNRTVGLNLGVNL